MTVRAGPQPLDTPSAPLERRTREGDVSLHLRAAFPGKQRSAEVAAWSDCGRAASHQRCRRSLFRLFTTPQRLGDDGLLEYHLFLCWPHGDLPTFAQMLFGLARDTERVLGRRCLGGALLAARPWSDSCCS